MSRAVVFAAYGGPDVVEVVDVEPPQPALGQVRVRVKAAGIQPWDAKVRRGAMADWLPLTLPGRLGSEFAGVVEDVGPDVTEVAPGDEVIGVALGGAHADHALAAVSSLVRKPPKIGWKEAGAIAASGRTAHTALSELGVQAGETVLVHAAAGGVGTSAIQLVRAWGATPVGTASARNHDYLRSLGAIPVAYGEGLAERVRELAPGGVDAALDAIGTEEALRASVELVADKNRIGTIAAEDAAKKLGVRYLSNDGEKRRLLELLDLYTEGRYSVPIYRAYPLEQADAAHREIESGHVRGKVVLVTDER